jgi:serine/threonine protein kinase
MIRHYGDADEHAVLIDFGVAVLRDGDRSITVDQNAVGALDYMAPEQLGGRLSDATDIYSLAAIVFEALTGARWRQAERDGRWETALGEMARLAPVFRMALDVNPRLRYNSVAAFREALRDGWEQID